MNTIPPHPRTLHQAAVYAWTVEGDLNVGSLDQYATATEQAHNAGLGLSPLHRLVVDDDGTLTVGPVALVEASTVTDDDYYVVTVTTPAGDRARYRIDLRA